ncbi:MAG: amidase [Comamonadaceae bacterium]|nr:MAG: amidase [Comamonadaceae bacterium]
MHPSLETLRRQIAAGQASATTEMERSIAAAQSPACRAVFRLDLHASARAQAAAPGIAGTPLAGLAVSVKDLFDIQGQPTAAGSTALSSAPAAVADSVAVARLRQAGAAFIGRTHMVEFAFSGVGVNPHFGTPAARDGRYGALAGPARVPGGSSSGAAVSVATGAAHIGLGSDTGGSIRIPAALNGIVGFKSTARLVPTDGALPLSTTLDTACALTRTVGDAIVAHEILAARRVVRSPAPLSACRLAVPTHTFLDGLDATVAAAFDRTLAQLRKAGAQITEVPLAETAQLADVNATGGFSAAESYAWHRHLLERAGAQYDPRVKARIERGARMTAFEYIDLVHARRAWIARMDAAMQGFDAFLSPTVPIQAPTIDAVAPADGLDAARDAQRDAEFVRVNGLLLRNTSVVNVLDGCGISLPCHQRDELPVGLMVWHGAMHDDAVLHIALAIERLLQEK